MKDFYSLLGTEVNCSPGEIDEAYQKLSEKFHPETNQSDRFFENRFKEIREAYEVLSDPVRRQTYDKQLKKKRPYAMDERLKIKRYHSRSKGLDIAFTVILLMLTVVFGNYVYKAIYSTKPVQVSKAPVVAPPVVVAPIKHHKRRHVRKIDAEQNTINNDLTAKNASAKGNSSIATIHTPVLSNSVKPMADVQLPGKTSVINKIAAVSKTPRPYSNVPENALPKPLPAHDNQQADNPSWHPDNRTTSADNADFLYTTYVKANETGVINMRRSESYNAEVIKVIPTDAQVAVLERGGFYYKVMFDHTIGYIPKWTLQNK